MLANASFCIFTLDLHNLSYIHSWVFWALSLGGQRRGKISQPAATSGQLLWVFFTAWDRQNCSKVNIKFFFMTLSSQSHKILPLSGLRMTVSSGTFTASKELSRRALCACKGTAEGLGMLTTISDKSFMQLHFGHPVYKRHDLKTRL